MSLESTLDQDLKTAMLAKDAQKVSTLRMLKSVLLYAKVASGTRGSDMADDVVLALLAKESKKRQESADLYKQGGNEQKASQELAEKAIIEHYLPTQLSEAELSDLVTAAVADSGASDMSKMGQIIAVVKAGAGPGADGGMIARLVKEKLSS